MLPLNLTKTGGQPEKIEIKIIKLRKAELGDKLRTFNYFEICFLSLFLKLSFIYEQTILKPNHSKKN